MSSIVVQKLERQAKREAKRFSVVVSLMALGLIATGVTMAIHASMREGYGFFAFFGVGLTLTTLILTVPVLVKTIKNGRIPE